MSDRPTAPWRHGLVDDGEEPVLRLVRWSEAWSEDDPDANFKSEVAAYVLQDPLDTLRNVARNLDVPIGTLARYVLVRWASGGAEGLMELGPSTVGRMRAAIRSAEEAGTADARLATYGQLRDMVAWLGAGLDADDAFPRGGAPRRRIRLAAYGLCTAADRVLLARIAPGEPGAGYWTLPGGGLDHGEEPREGARREIHEETGLDAEVGDLLEVYSRRFAPDHTPSGDDIHSVQLVFAASVPTGQPPRVIDVDGSTDAARWVPYDELDALPLVTLAKRAADDLLRSG